MESSVRHLIVNADDFGQSAGINRGIIEAHERGIVTSASLMVRWPAAAQAAEYARAQPNFSIGLHVDLGEWFCRNGEWKSVYQVVDTGDAAAVRTEIGYQFETFSALVGTNPTHIDSHQHVHLEEPARGILKQIANELGVPLRSCNCEIAYIGSFYGQTAEGMFLPDVISVAGLMKIIDQLPLGVSELGCHPGYADNLETMYRDERAEEIKVLCDPLIKKASADRGIELTSFAQLSLVA